jgi:hypothetical protein
VTSAQLVEGINVRVPETNGARVLIIKPAR